MKKSYQDPRLPKSFPPDWAVMWGDNEFSLVAGHTMPDGKTLRLHFVEAVKPDPFGFWISGTLDKASLQQLQQPKNDIPMRLATDDDCLRATAYFSPMGSQNIPPDCADKYPPLGKPFEPGKHLVIPDCVPSKL